MEKWILEDVARADRLALQARSAARAGDMSRAGELRRQFETIYDELEAKIADSDRAAVSMARVRAELEAV